MQTKLALRPRSSILARLGVAAVVGGVLAGMPTSEALAAESMTESSTESLAERPVSDAPLVELRDMLRATGFDARARMQALVSSAFDRTVVRADVARDRMERLVTFGYGFDGLASFDAWEADEDEPLEPSPTSTGRPQRFEFATDTNDPLAGL